MDDKIKGMILPLNDNLKLFLPCEAVAEIIHYQKPYLFKSDGAPNYVLGIIEWREQVVPVICLESLYFDINRHIQIKSKLAILDGFKNSNKYPYLAILLNYYPYNFVINKTDNLSFTESNEKFNTFTLNDSSIILPNFDYLYSMSLEFYEKPYDNKVVSYIPDSDSFPT